MGTEVGAETDLATYVIWYGAEVFVVVTLSTTMSTDWMPTLSAAVTPTVIDFVLAKDDPSAGVGFESVGATVSAAAVKTNGPNVAVWPSVVVKSVQNIHLETAT